MIYKSLSCLKILVTYSTFELSTCFRKRLMFNVHCLHYNLKNKNFEQQQCKNQPENTHCQSIQFSFSLQMCLILFFRFFCRSILWLIGWYIIICWQFSFFLCVFPWNLDRMFNILKYFIITFYLVHVAATASEKEREKMTGILRPSKTI